MASCSTSEPSTLRDPNDGISPANVPPAVTPLSKLVPLKRTKPESSIMADSEFVIPWPLKKKSRISKPKSSRESLKERRASLLNQCPAVEVKQVMSDPIEPNLAASSSKLRPVYKTSKPENGYPVRIPQSHLDALQASIREAQLRIADLEQELEEQAQANEQQQLIVKQNVMLDHIKATETFEKKINTLKRERHFLHVDVVQQKKEAMEAKAKLSTMTEKYNTAFANWQTYKVEVEHLQSVNKTFEEDIDELRQIENENAALRRQQAQGLPPAYASLEDEDQAPPYWQHKDNGVFDTAHLKRNVRNQYMQRLLNAQARTEAARASPHLNDKAGGDTMVFYGASTALSEACGSLKRALDSAQDVVSTRFLELMAKCKASGVADPGTAIQFERQQIKCSHARRDYIADRIAKLILDLSWRVISACELRPTSLHLTAYEKAKLGLAFKDVDDTLLEALRAAFSYAEDESGDRAKVRARKAQMLFEYQAYLTQIQTLAYKFRLLRAGVGFSYFTRSQIWLCEKVETERYHQANTVDNPGDGQEVESLVDW